MLFPIRQLIEGRGKPLCVSTDTKVRDALALMRINDYSQLPIIDQAGKMTGIITEQSIISTYYHTRGEVSLLDLNVDHCQTTPTKTSPDTDIFDALELLKNVYAIVVVQDGNPIGIVTAYDTTQFFQSISGGLILVEDIEVTLRQYIEKIFETEKARNAALMKAFGASKREPAAPAKKYDELTLWDYMNLITTEANWQNFESYFNPKELFFELINQVRQIRNQLSHFRGRLDPIQHDALIRARDWISSRPKMPSARQIHVPEIVPVPGRVDLKVGENFSPLFEFLQNIKTHGSVKVNLSELDGLLAEPLPPAARDHRSWWENDYFANPQALAWLSAGWLVEDVDFTSGEVVFRQSNRALYPVFFADLLEGLKSTRPGVTQTQKAALENWLWFSAGASGFYFGWTLPKEPVLRVELYIDRGDRQKNKQAFDTLLEQRESIEGQIGESLNWDRLDNRRASRISKASPFQITAPPEDHERIKSWGVGMVLKFIDAFQPRLRGL